MKRPDGLPPVFAQYVALVNYVQQVSGKEWSSSCPKCGGAPHSDGEWSDRCRWFLDEKPLGWCRQCGEVFWPDASEGWQPPTAEEMERWRQERAAREEARRRSAERALENLRRDKVWLRYHEQLDQHARRYWQRRGIPDEWQNYWRLGWSADYQIRQPDGNHAQTATATIPLFDALWNVLNVKHRLIDPPANIGKYRYEVAGQAHPLFLTNPDNEISGHVVAIEGELKAAVTYIFLRQLDMCLVGLPGSNVGKDIDDMLRRCDRLTLIFDPGGERALFTLAKRVGIHKCYGIVTPEKIDDGILAAHLDSFDLRLLIQSATKLSAFA